MNANRVYFSIKCLHAVLHVQDASNGLVSTFHASFSDSLLDKQRSNKFYCDQVKHNVHLAFGCFNVMTKELCFNICHLTFSSVFASDISDLMERIQQYISASLYYACRYWQQHF